MHSKSWCVSTVTGASTLLSGLMAGWSLRSGYVSSWINDIALQGDGKLLAVGSALAAVNFDMSVGRLTPDAIRLQARRERNHDN